jgi:hypothetical protein
MAQQPTEVPANIHRLPFSESGSVHAPFLYFEEVTTFGVMNGMFRITLEAARLYVGTHGELVVDRVAVAHLRMNREAALALKAALEGTLLLATPMTSDAKN